MAVVPDTARDFPGNTPGKYLGAFYKGIFSICVEDGEISFIIVSSEYLLWKAFYLRPQLKSMRINN